MAKKNSNNPLFTIDILLDKFTDYLRDQNFSEDSIVKYKGVHVFFDSDFRGQVMKDQERNFMDLVPKLLCTKSFSGRYMDRNGKIIPGLTGWGIIDNIITGIDNDLFKNITLPQKTKTESNYQSYANKFFKFIKTVYGNEKSKYYITKLTKGYNRPSLSAADLAVLAGTQGEIYLHNSLCTKFKSRLRSQDRTSGDKIWLPLRFIAKIYSKDKKNHDKNANKNGKKVNQFSNWLDMLVNDIHIHYIENNKVKKISFGGEKGKDDVHLCLVNHFDNGVASDEFDVYVRWINKKGKVIQRHVLTPTGKGNEKECMKVRDISEIAIDHVKSIDRTLRDLSDDKNNKLKELKKVSDKYKEIQAEDEPDEDIAVDELLEPESELDLEELRKELDLIKDDGLLRLMASKYNSQKSNGDTFKEIRKIADDKYIGIIEENIKMEKSPNDKSMTLYQELTDVFSQTGNLTIAYNNSESLNGQNVNEIRKFKLEDIINRI